MKTKKLRWETENLRHGGHTWAIGSVDPATPSATLYIGLTQKDKWKKRVTVYFNDYQQFYDSKLYNMNYKQLCSLVGIKEN